MNTPSPRYFCPRCQTVFEQPSNYCGRCGADMRRASSLERALSSTPPGDDSAEWSDSGEERWPARERRTQGRDPWLGRVVDARYKVVEIIGRGGMGVVYKVEHQRMGKVAAMKVLHGDLAGEPEVIGRFRREAEAVSRLDHPNTVQVFDFGTSDGALYLIMEYIRGLDLGMLVRRDGPLPFERAAPLFGQICAALIEAHELDIVHRDLKPENVLVTRTHGGRDFVKVLDFGLAKLGERDVSEVTDRGSIVGTPYFMSPEQIRGDDIDARSDLYSLGALMYRVLTARHPYTAKTPVGVLTKHLTAPLEPPSARRPELRLDPRVDAIVMRAMQKQAADRYQSAAELLADIEDAFLALADQSGPIRFPGAGWGPRRSASQADPADDSRDDIDYGIDTEARLRRSDLDVFERSLRRRRTLFAVATPLLLAGAAAGGGYAVLLRPEAAQLAEREPNDELDRATLIAAGTEVRGFIGKRISKTEPDRDYYRVKQRPAPDGSDTVSAHVTGVPNMDLALAIYDATGRLLAASDEGGVGHGEWIHRVRVSGEVFVQVSQVSPGPRLPVENVSDAYALVVTIDPAGPGFEREPNESPADAVRLEVGQPVSGYLDRRADVDVYRFAGAAGRHRVTIGGAEAVPLRWQVDGGEWRTERDAVLELADGAIVTLARSDRDRDRTAGLPGVDEMYTIEVRRAD